MTPLSLKMDTAGDKSPRARHFNTLVYLCHWEERTLIQSIALAHITVLSYDLSLGLLTICSYGQ